MAPQYLIDVYISHPNGPGGRMLIIQNMSRDNLEFYSNEIHRRLVNDPVKYETHRIITLEHGVPAALSKVLNIIHNHKGKGPFYVGGLKSATAAQKCYIWQACDLLDIRDQVAWDRVTKDLKFHYSHRPITPEGMRALFQVFAKYKDDAIKGQVWNTFVNQYAWDTLQKKYPQDKQDELDLELLNYPTLQQAIIAREEELRPKVMQYGEHMKENAERREQNRATKHARSQKKYEGGQERLRRKHAEQVLAGEREYYPELEPYLQELKAQRKAAKA